MPPPVRHRGSKPGKAPVTHLPAMMRLRERGGATRITGTTLAYLAGMGGDTFGHRRVAPLRALPPPRPSRSNRRALAPRTYWRRRFIVLVVGLAAFGLGAWGLSTALVVNVSPGRSPSRSHLSETRRPGTGAIGPASCPAGDVVLSVFTGQREFGAGQLPLFDVNVVSTQQAACSLNIGPRNIALVIADGQTQIWSSADCAADTGGLMAVLERGVPRVLVISWDRQVGASGGCDRPVPASAGAYTAYVVDGALRSAPLSFRLSSRRQ